MAHPPNRKTWATAESTRAPESADPSGRRCAEGRVRRVDALPQVSWPQARDVPPPRGVDSRFGGRQGMRELGIGMIGYKFMGKAHSNAYSTVGRFFDLEATPVMRCLAGRSAAGAKTAASRLGWASS